ncbi:Bug family tripartite tricarboxylate transporter substrate binding protein [Cupriavidus alkaliphilus]|uniref:Bug family tripartite tricarboxylate transporter substrate binding protein n=1 Tax=Cupriavidus alkaliphilus TaxID=942866 RepID=UPI0008163191|nr:tripartite tricarboxylate transporter substrate binding protein [Cupriavidus alkaliphilus]MBB2917113.1 tripartite-type tricarboxylate transporter receptor subunit TctC [Cupriavidus alkaliphilus]RAS08712.1 tripartite-type tricarboxylate transporter receptor subunit TctC [Cupriavidus alkaliphilus]SCB22915.1 Tripartite-type tricarboxylate transporter, receptor component TctC [Cupriavidus alkaliphilus]
MKSSIKHRVARSARSIAIAVAGVAAAHTAPTALAADAWPAKPIKVIVPYTPGGSTDTVSRVVFEQVSQRLGQPIIIENKPGANSTLGVGVAARSAPDGYTFVSVLAAYSANMSLYSKLSYKPADLVPVAEMAELPLFLFASKKVPARTVAELVDYGKKHPDTLTFGSSGVGSSAHLTGERLAMESKLKLTHVPYNGSAPILPALVSGEVSVAFDPLLVPMPHVKSGKINVLAVASAKRWPGEPNIPTMEEAGFPGFVMSSWTGLLAPAGTPQPIVARMAREIAAATRSPEVTKKLTDLGFVPVGGTPEEFRKLIERDTRRYAEIVKAGKITLD